jgi:hypothetical protein
LLIGTFSSSLPVVLDAKMSFLLGILVFITVIKSYYSKILYDENIHNEGYLYTLLW